MSIPKVSVYAGASLDGFIAREDGGLDWLYAVLSPGQDYGYAVFMADVDMLFIGRGTYDTVLGMDPWPYVGKRVGVFTHREGFEDARVEVLQGAIRPQLERMGAAGVRHVYLDGGKLIRQGLAEGVVDELTVSVLPKLLGRGIPLFGPEVPEIDWRLRRSEAFPTGLVQLRYFRP